MSLFTAEGLVKRFGGLLATDHVDLAVEAGEIHARLAALVNLMHSLDAFLAIEKVLLVEQGIFSNILIRGPVGYRLDEMTKQEVLRLFAALKEVCGR